MFSFCVGGKGFKKPLANCLAIAILKIITVLCVALLAFFFCFQVLLFCMIRLKFKN